MQDMTLRVGSTLIDLVRASAERFPALTFHSIEHGTRRTLLEILEQADAVASALVARGVAPGEPIGVVLPNALETLAVFFGVLRAGAILVPLAAPAGLANRRAVLARLA